MILQGKFNESYYLDSIEQIVCSSLEESKVTKIDLIRDSRNSSNIANIECGGDILSNHPDRQARIEKISKTLKYKMSLLTKEELNDKFGLTGAKNGMYGKSHTEISKQKISQAIKKHYLDKESPLKGVPLSKERVNKLSEMAKQRKGDKNPFYGKKHTQEVKDKLAASRKGKTPSNITPVLIHGVYYASLREAHDALGTPVVTIRHRVLSNSPKFIDWKYA